MSILYEQQALATDKLGTWELIAIVYIVFAFFFYELDPLTNGFPKKVS